MVGGWIRKGGRKKSEGLGKKGAAGSLLAGSGSCQASMGANGRAKPVISQLLLLLLPTPLLFSTEYYSNVCATLDSVVLILAPL